MSNDELIARLVRATGLSISGVRKILKEGRLPTNTQLAKKWAKVMESIK